jgi:hypothetical protein
MKTCSLKMAILATGLLSMGAVSEAQQPHATLAEQKTCAAQASTFYKESTDFANTKNATKNEFTSHYDPATKACYVRINVTVFEDKKAAVSSYIFDAFEGRSLGTYLWFSYPQKKYWEVKPTMCNVKPAGSPKQSCTSTEEFEALVDKFFGLGE